MLDIKQIADVAQAGQALASNGDALTKAIKEVAQAPTPEARASAQKIVDALEEERGQVQTLIREKGWDLR